MGGHLTYMGRRQGVASNIEYHAKAKLPAVGSLVETPQAR